MSDVRISQVVFTDEVVEITFTERRDVTKRGLMVRTCIIESRLVEAELEEAQESLQDLLDSALELIRNPPRRLRGGEEEEDEDEGDDA